MIIDIEKKYFALISRLEILRTKEYFFDITIRGKDVKGLHFFIGKIYFSFYLRLGKL